MALPERAKKFCTLWTGARGEQHGVLRSENTTFPDVGVGEDLDGGWFVVEATWGFFPLLAYFFSVVVPRIPEGHGIASVAGNPKERGHVPTIRMAGLILPNKGKGDHSGAVVQNLVRVI